MNHIYSIMLSSGSNCIYKVIISTTICVSLKCLWRLQNMCWWPLSRREVNRVYLKLIQMKPQSKHICQKLEDNTKEKANCFGRGCFWGNGCGLWRKKAWDCWFLHTFFSAVWLECHIGITLITIEYVAVQVYGSIVTIEMVKPYFVSSSCWILNSGLMSSFVTLRRLGN